MFSFLLTLRVRLVHLLSEFGVINVKKKGKCLLHIMAGILP
jgi:hypothetical protein